MLEQTPFGVAETIDTLLDISYDQVIRLIALALVNEGGEVVPLQCARILKLIYHVMAEVLAISLVDERCILSVNDLIDQLIGLGDR